MFVAACVLPAWMTACQELELGLGLEGNDSEEPVESPGPSSAAEGLKIGAILPYTGKLAGLGRPMLDVLPLVVDQVNSCGGINNQSISLVVEDDQSQPDVAAQAMTKLIESDEVDVAIVGFIHSTSPIALDIAVQNKIPTISPGSTSAIFTERAEQGDFQGFWARTVPSATHQAQALAKLAIDRRYRQVSTLVTDSDDGRSFEQAFTTAFEQLGGTVLNKDFPTRYNPEETSLSNAALDAFLPYTGIPNAVVAELDPRGGALLLRTAYELNLLQGKPLMLAYSIQPKSFVEAVGRTYDDKYILAGTVGTAPSASSPASDTLTNLWEQDGKTPEVYVPQTWDAVALLALAAQAANSYEGEAIRQQLQAVANPPGTEVTDICTGLKLLQSGQEINYQGTSGNVDLDKNGDVTGSYDVWTVDEQGKIEIINQINLD